MLCCYPSIPGVCVVCNSLPQLQEILSLSVSTGTVQWPLCCHDSRAQVTVGKSHRQRELARISFVSQCSQSQGQWTVLVLPTLGRWTPEDQELKSVPQLLTEFDISLST